MCSRHRDFYLYVKCMYCLKRRSVEGKDLRWPRACWAVRKKKKQTENLPHEVELGLFSTLSLPHILISERCTLHKVVTGLTVIRLGNIPQRLKHRIRSFTGLNPARYIYSKIIYKSDKIPSALDFKALLIAYTVNPAIFTSTECMQGKKRAAHVPSAGIIYTSLSCD